MLCRVGMLRFCVLSGDGQCLVWGNVRGVVRKEVQHIEGGRAADRVGYVKFFSRRRTRACCARAFQQRFSFFAVTSVTFVVKW